jgi:hypothetical protein
MAMMVPRESWTDERLDDLKENMVERFDQVDQRFDQVDKRFEQVDQRFEQVERRMAEGFSRVDADIRELRRMMFQGFIALVTVIVTCFVGLAGLIVF